MRYSIATVSLGGTLREKLEARFDLDAELADRLHELNILCDEDELGRYFQVNTRVFPDRFFFEVIGREVLGDAHVDRAEAGKRPIDEEYRRDAGGCNGGHSARGDLCRGAGGESRHQGDPRGLCRDRRQDMRRSEK